MKHDDFLKLVPYCTREQLEACAQAKSRATFESIVQARYADLCEGEPLPHSLQLVVLEAVHSRAKRDVLELLRTAVKWKNDGEIDEAINVCREAVQSDPTILWSRKLLEKLEKLKADPDSEEAEEAPVSHPEPPQIIAPSAKSEPTIKASKGCFTVVVLALMVICVAFGASAIVIWNVSR